MSYHTANIISHISRGKRRVTKQIKNDVTSKLTLAEKILLIFHSGRVGSTRFDSVRLGLTRMRKNEVSRVTFLYGTDSNRDELTFGESVSGMHVREKVVQELLVDFRYYADIRQILNN